MGRVCRVKRIQSALNQAKIKNKRAESVGTEVGSEGVGGRGGEGEGGARERGGVGGERGSERTGVGRKEGTEGMFA
jgi:hypothetical protein